MNDIAKLRARLEALEAEVAALRREIDSLSGPPEAVGINAASGAEQKISLYLDRFVGRRDVFAQAWESRSTGRQGWSPAVRGGFYDRQKSSHDFLPLTPQVIEEHLRGHGQPAGLYVMMPGDLCQVLICDFDGGQWRADAAAYVSACGKNNIDALTEISRSGNGAHVWIFFEEPIGASLARAAGFALLRDAMRARPEMSFTSYDRFFPAQDTLSSKSTGAARLGNLIALPLHGGYRRNGTMVFADPATWKPLPDQFAALAEVVPVACEEIEKIAVTKQEFGPQAELPPRPERGRPQAAKDITVDIQIDNVLHISTSGLPTVILTELKHRASLPNPEFYRRQAQRMSTYGIPRVVIRFEHDEQEIRLPRGLLDETIRVLEHEGFTTRLIQSRKDSAERLEVTFTGRLRRAQEDAVEAVLAEDTGVLVAPPGTGKTVMACAVIAKRRLSTAIIVNRAELLTQWRERLSEFLDLGSVKIGQLGSGRRKRNGKIDLIMLQSISRADSNPLILNEYDQIIIDECHNIAAPAAEDAFNRITTGKILGLTATPYRSDRMDEIITMQCGPIRHTLTAELINEERFVIVHPTEFITDKDCGEQGAIQEIYNELAVDEKRNRLIMNTVRGEVGAGRNCLILVNRITGLKELSSGLRALIDAQVLVMHGGQSKAERTAVRGALDRLTKHNEPYVLVAMGKVAGEGLDLPNLQSLFLAAPISFKGVVVQQTGRVTREAGRTTEAATAFVHDFVDEQVGVLARMHRRRLRTMQKEGFQLHKLNPSAESAQLRTLFAP